MKTSVKYPVLLLVMFVCCNFLIAQTNSVYVSATGNDHNQGTISSPLQTINAALLKIVDTAANIIYVRGGDYYITNTINVPSIANKGSLIITAYSNEKVSLIGGISVNPALFKPVTDPAILQRLTEAAQQHVLVADLYSIAIDSIEPPKPSGFGHDITTPTAIELFTNDKLQTLARWPNNSKIKISEVIDPGPTNISTTGSPKNSAVFNFNTEKIPHWSPLNKDIFIEGMFSEGYLEEGLPVAKIQNNTITVQAKTTYGIHSSFDNATNNTHDPDLLSMRGFYFKNILEEVDSSSEYYIDRGTGKLYYWPSEDISTSTMILSQLKEPIIQISHSQNITISNLSLKDTRGNGININQSTNVKLDHLNINHTGAAGIKAFRVSKSSIINSIIINTGSEGIDINGGDRKNLIGSENLIKNCEFFNYGRIHKTPPAVNLNGVGITVSNCYFHDGLGISIYFQGNDHIIENNIFNNVATNFRDLGAVYTGRDPSSAGTQINNNAFANVSNSFGMTTAIYIDDGGGGIIVNNNIFYQCGSNDGRRFGAVHVNGGANNYFNNNVFIQCTLAFSNSQWDDERWRNTYFKNPANKNRITNENSDIRSIVYLKKYPFLAGFFDTASAKLAPRNNYVRNIILYNGNRIANASSSFQITNQFQGQLLGAELKQFFAKNHNKNFTEENIIIPIPNESKSWDNWQQPDIGKIGILSN